MWALPWIRLVVVRLQFVVSASATLVANSRFAAASAAVNRATEAIAAVERKVRARIGLTVLHPHGSLAIARRARERFPLASTQKLALVMTVLARRDLDPNHAVRISRTDLDSPDYSYISEHYPNGGTLRLADICALTISHSDNTGADVLARLVGGPHAVTTYLRSIGVTDVRIDRTERELPDEADESDPRDTGTPQATAHLVWRLAYASPLAPGVTHTLLTWMFATVTGNKRIRAGVPQGWRVADKTGSYANAANDIGLTTRLTGRRWQSHVTWTESEQPTMVAKRSQASSRQYARCFESTPGASVLTRG